MSIAPQVPVSDRYPTPTPEMRCALAVGMLHQRVWDLRLCQLLEAVMRGVTLAELVDFEVRP